MDQSNVEDIYPLTPLQEGMLFHAELEPGSPVYWNRLALTLKGELDISLFQLAWKNAVERHPALRTGVARSRSGQALQIVHRQVELDWHYESFAQKDSHAAEVLLQALCESQSLELPNLKQPPLIRVVVVELSPRVHKLIWWQHHLVLDGWSWPIILKEVFEDYEALCSGRPDVLPAAPAFSSYLGWLKDQDNQAAKTYWTAYLSDMRETTRICAPEPPAAEKAGFDLYRVVLDTDLSDAFRAFCRREKVTLNTLVQCAWGLTLATELASEQVVFGATLALRPADIDRVEEMVGMLLATIPIRLQDNSARTVGDWLRDHQSAFQDSMGHAHCSLSDIASWSELGTAEDLFESIVVFENFPFSESLVGRCQSLEVTALEAEELTSYPISLLVVPLASFEFKLSIRSGSLDPVLASRMLDRFVHILGAITEAPNVEGISRLLPAELKRASKMQGPIVRIDDTVLDLIAKATDRFPESCAVEFDTDRFSYQALWKRAGCIARGILQTGVQPGELVGVGMTRSADMVAAVIGIWRAGAAYVPLDPTFPEVRLKSMSEKAGLDVVLTDLTCSSLYLEMGLTTLALEDVSSAEFDPATLPEINLADTAYVMFTSGSTGQPNGVEIQHAAVSNLLQSMARLPGLKSDDRLLAVTTLSFDISVLELFGPLIVGGTTVVAETGIGNDVRRLANSIEASGATVMQATPATWAMLIQSGWQGQSELRVLSGGERLSEDLAGALLARVNSLWNLYGPTETTVWSTCAVVEHADQLTIGCPIDNTQVRVVDWAGRPVPPGVTGELLIGGAGVSSGYFGNKRLTEERFSHTEGGESGPCQWFHTRDLVSLAEGDELKFHGRSDHQIKLRGFRIEVGDVESHLAEAPGVDRVAVALRAHPTGDTRLVAYVVPAQGQGLDEALLRQYLQEHVPGYMVPQHFVTMPELPLTHNLKVDYGQLPRLEVASQPDHPSRPLSDPEQAVARIWSELLGQENIQPNDNFIQLGGHSLLLARLASRLESALGHRPALSNLLAAPTLAGHAALFSGKAPQAPQSVRLSRRNSQSEFPLSSIQRRLWFLEQLEAGAGVHNVFGAFDIAGELDVDRLRRAFFQLAERHEILRTVFVVKDEQPVQQVLQEPQLTWLETDEDSDHAVDLKLQKLSSIAFELHQAPPWLIQVIRCGSKHTLAMCFHHMLIDGESITILIKELTALYDGVLDSSQPQSVVQYGDFSLWQQESIEREGTPGKAMTFWQETLSGTLPILRFPSLKTRPPEQQFAGQSVKFELPHKDVANLKRIAKAQDETLFTLLLSAFSAVMLRYCRQDEVVIGVPVGTVRHLVGADRAIGPYLNTVALRLTSQPNWRFSEYLLNTSAVARAAFEHGDVPFEHLVSQLKLPRDLSRTPVFQVLFSHRHERDDAFQLPGVRIEKRDVAQTVARTDLSCWVQETPTRIQLELEFASELFEVGVVDQFCQHLGHYLRHIVTEPSACWRDIPIMDAQSLRAIASRGGPYCPDLPECVGALIWPHVERDPDAIAVRSSHGTYTYGQLRERSLALAGALRHAGIKPGTLVGMAVARTHHLPLVLLSILEVGAAYVPVDSDHPADRLNDVFADSGIKALITDLPDPWHLLDFAGSVLDLEALLSGSHTTPRLDIHQADSDDLAYVMYTSGSTGRPKGVKIGQKQVVNLLTGMQAPLRMDQHDVLAAITTATFDISVLELLLPLTVGGQVYVVDEQTAADGKLLAQVLADSKSTIMQGTPASWKLLFESGWPGDKRLKAVCGGEALPPDLADTLRQQCGAAWNVYGPTETTVWSSLNEISSQSKPQTSSISIGQAIQNTQIYVVDQTGNLVPDYVEGEIMIAGSGVAQGYLNRPELTATRFCKDPYDPNEAAYRTGDLGRWLPDKSLEHRGRIDSQLKVRGYRIEAGDVESHLLEAEQVDQVAVAVRAGPSGDPRLVAFVRPTAGSGVDAMSLRRHLRDRLPSYMVPQHFVRIDTLPLTPNRKVDYAQLPGLHADLAGGSGDAPPETLGEIEVARVWLELLGVSRVSLADNFFELGGHSMLTMTAIARIERSTGVELSPQMFVVNTLGAMGALVEQRMIEQPEEDQSPRPSRGLRGLFRKTTKSLLGRN